MKKRLGTAAAVFMSLSAAVVALSACGRQVTDKALEKPMPAPLEIVSVDLKRTVGIFPFESKSNFLGPESVNVFQDNFHFALQRECSNLNIDAAENGETGSGTAAIPQKADGTIDNIELVRIGRTRGYNAIITGSLDSINANEEDSGMLWFKDKYYYFRVQIHFDAYDTETGAKLLDQNLKRDIEVDGFDVDLFRKKKRIEPYVLEEAFEEMIAQFSEDVCDVVMDQPWKGYVVAIKEDRIVVSAGRRAGLTPGVVMFVFHSDQMLEGAGGQRYFLPGTKVAKVQIQHVEADRAEALKIAGGIIRVGDLVQPE